MCGVYVCRAAWARYKDAQTASQHSGSGPQLPTASRPINQRGLEAFLVRGPEAHRLAQHRLQGVGGGAGDDKDGANAEQQARVVQLEELKSFDKTRAAQYRRADVPDAGVLAGYSDRHCAALAKRMFPNTCGQARVQAVLKARDNAKELVGKEQEAAAARAKRREEDRRRREQEAQDAERCHTVASGGGRGTSGARSSAQDGYAGIEEGSSGMDEDGALAQAIAPPFGNFADPDGYGGRLLSASLVSDLALYYFCHNEADLDSRVTAQTSTVLKLDWTMKGLPEKVCIVV